MGVFGGEDWICHLNGNSDFFSGEAADVDGDVGLF